MLEEVEKDVRRSSDGIDISPVAIEQHDTPRDNDLAVQSSDAQVYPKGFTLTVILLADALAVFLVCLIHALQTHALATDTSGCRSRWT